MLHRSFIPTLHWRIKNCLSLPSNSLGFLWKSLCPSSSFSNLSGEPSSSFSWIHDLLWLFFQILPFFCSIPDFSEASKLPHSVLPSSLGRFLPFMSLTFPTPLNFSILWSLSSIFCYFAFLFHFSEILFFIFFGLFLSYIIFPLPFSSDIGRAFLFRKYVQLLLPTFFLFLLLPDPLPNSLHFFLCRLPYCPPNYLAHLDFQSFLLPFCHSFFFILVIHLFCLSPSLFHSKLVWSRTLENFEWPLARIGR